MRVCGVELKGSEAVICLVSYKGDSYNVPECRRHSFTLEDAASQEAIREFHFAFHKLLEDYQVDEVVLIAREYKGKFAGSASSFKLESAIQLSDKPVAMLTPQAIREQNKRNPPLVEFAALELRKFQQSAFEAAYAYLTQKRFAKD
ncbi:DUF3010 family protein [Shewanella yunxiaonensis]|uniref:DUF3010 family protein n=1 Tax=Shewanella yunxiaonensis TaxID=2829809 RepID=A0ABX7YPI2_9GAMM|nr:MULTISPECIES: DUF3010 family protein [Shewanella]MDF0533591.1 DUF3010 family protein [Shewanella sp. A32]QUN04659.1 DUF3010 family protein [Shewanella yunxiaonensis]